MNCAKQQLLLFSADVNNATQESGVNQAYGRALVRGTQREYSSKPLKHSIVKRILVFKR